MHFNLSFPGNQTHHLRFSSGTCYLSFLPVATFHVRRTRGASHDYLPTRMSLWPLWKYVSRVTLRPRSRGFPLCVRISPLITLVVTRTLIVFCSTFSESLWDTLFEEQFRNVDLSQVASSERDDFKSCKMKNRYLVAFSCAMGFSNSRVEFPKFSLRLAERVLGDFTFSNDFQNGLI